MNATTTEVSEIDQLAFDLEAAKTHELHAKEARLAIEEKLVALVEKKEEGTISKKGDYYKLSVTFGIDRKVDSDIARSLAIQLGDEYERIFKWEAKIDTKEMRFLIDKKPEVYALCARAITSKPRKPSLKIEEVSK